MLQHRYAFFKFEMEIIFLYEKIILLLIKKDPHHFKIFLLSLISYCNLKIRSGILCVQLYLISTTFYKIIRINKILLLHRTCHSKVISLHNCSLFKSKGMLKKKMMRQVFLRTEGKGNCKKHKGNFSLHKALG